MTTTNNYRLPEPIPAYPLPNGGAALSPEEWASRVADHDCKKRADAYADALPSDVTKAQRTRVRNTVAEFLLWEISVDAVRTAAQQLPPQAPV